MTLDLIISSLVWLGLLQITITFLWSRTRLQPINYKTKIAKSINLSYLVSFILMIVGWNETTIDLGVSNTWIETVVLIILVVFISGAFIEAQKDFPLLHNQTETALRILKASNLDGYLLLHQQIGELGLQTAIQKHYYLFEAQEAPMEGRGMVSWLLDSFLSAMITNVSCYDFPPDKRLGWNLGIMTAPKAPDICAMPPTNIQNCSLENP